MKNPAPAPIPIPPAQRWHDLRRRAVPVMVFCAVIGVIAFLWDRHVAAPTLVGQAETRLAAVSSYQPGVLVGLTVNRFQAVKAGDVIGRVLITDPPVLESSLAVIRAEIELLRVNLAPVAMQQRNAINYAQLRLDWMKERTDLATARVNLQLNEMQFHRYEDALKNDAVTVEQRDIARAAYQASQHQVEELATLVAEGAQSFNDLQITNTADLSKISDAPLRAAIAVQESKLRQTEAELDPVTLKSPIDGRVSMINHWSGEAVMGGETIVSIASAESQRIVGYLCPPLAFEPAIGDRVAIHTRGRHRVSALARIQAVGAQFEPLPAVLCGPVQFNLAPLGLPLDISLPGNLSLHPGELVDITLLPKTD
jgi:multidrug resistance efflux pump